jgi:hypothetical protein
VAGLAQVVVSGSVEDSVWADSVGPARSLGVLVDDSYAGVDRTALASPITRRRSTGIVPKVGPSHAGPRSRRSSRPMRTTAVPTTLGRSPVMLTFSIGRLEMEELSARRAIPPLE